MQKERYGKEEVIGKKTDRLDVTSRMKEDMVKTMMDLERELTLIILVVASLIIITGILRRVQEEEVDLTLKEVLNVVEGVEEVVMAVDSEIEEIIPLLKDPKLDLKDIVEVPAMKGEEAEVTAGRDTVAA